MNKTFTVQDIFDIAGELNNRINSYRKNLTLIVGKPIDRMTPEELDQELAGDPGKELLAKNWRSTMALWESFHNLEVQIDLGGLEPLLKETLAPWSQL
jgi:hypothetical protein